MFLPLNSLFAKAIRGQGTWFIPSVLGQKVLCLSILILLVTPFQLSGPLLQASFAAERLSVVQLDELNGKPAFQSFLTAIQNSGFTPRTIREADFSFNVNAKTTSSVVVPVGGHVSPEAITMLGRYMASGGRVILAPTGEALDASVIRLFSLVGLPVTGQSHATQNLAFHWKGLLLSSGESLPKSSPVLIIQPNERMEVLATWGSDLPAIATTSRGAVLNWQLGQTLSEISSIVALSKVVYPGRSDSPIVLQPEESTLAQYASNKTLISMAPARSVEPIGSDVQPNPKTPVSPSVIALPATVTKPADSVSPTASGNQPDKMQDGAKPSETDKPWRPVADSVIPLKSTSPSTAASPANAGPSKTQPATSANPIAPAQTNPPVQVMAASAKQVSTSRTEAKKPVAASASSKSASADSDNEVLNNILGTHGDDPIKTDGTPAANTGKTDAKQQHFSFLDPGAAAVLAPAFDYGVYSMNLRKLDDYKRRVRDALEAGRQLSLDLPEDKVSALLKEADLHRRKFENLYLAGQTQAGLDENVLAHRSALQALALTTTSPQVEGRAIWMDRGSIIACGNADGLRAKIQKFHQAGINMIYFETINAGFPIYPSKLVKHNPMVNGWDPLRVAVDEGHKQGMEVHAWVWCFAVGNRRHNALINQPDDYAGPILTEAGMMGEALRNHDGGLSVDSHQHEFWLSPASPRARDFLVNLYKEIVSNYDVDGLQLDYIRYPFQTPGNKMGYEAVGRARFAQATGKSLDGMDDYTSRVWTAWKTYQVTAFVQQVSTSLKQIKPELKLSAAVFPMHRDARIAMIQQDWETWIDNGWIDTLSPMSYTSDPGRLQELFEYVQASPHKHMLVYPGVALFRLDGGQLVQQLEAVRQKGSLGTTFFAGSHLSDDKASILASGPYKLTNSLPPHHDVVKSMQAILDDYQQKLAILRKKGVLNDVPAAQMGALQTALAQLNDSLTAMGSGRPLSGISKPKLAQVQNRLNELKAQSQTWSAADKQVHPYRAEYFERDVMLLSELMGYTLDKLGMKLSEKPAIVPDAEPTATKAQPTSPAAAAILAPSSQSEATATTKPTGE